MLEDKAIAKLKKILGRNRVSKDAGVFDPEVSHGQADKVLCDLLETLGYSNVVEAYNAIEPKWYA